MPGGTGGAKRCERGEALRKEKGTKDGLGKRQVITDGRGATLSGSIGNSNIFLFPLLMTSQAIFHSIGGYTTNMHDLLIQATNIVYCQYTAILVNTVVNVTCALVNLVSPWSSFFKMRTPDVPRSPDKRTWTCESHSPPFSTPVWMFSRYFITVITRVSSLDKQLCFNKHVDIDCMIK